MRPSKKRTIFKNQRTMKLTIKTNDRIEINRLVKANDMAGFIRELVLNGWRQFEETDYDYEPAWKAINELLQDWNINLTDID